MILKTEYRSFLLLWDEKVSERKAEVKFQVGENECLHFIDCKFFLDANPYNLEDWRFLRDVAQFIDDKTKPGSVSAGPRRTAS